jgi:hypothetical protein
VQITGYKIDLSKPYRIISIDKKNQTVHIDGCSTVIQREDGEYGGICGIWKDVPFEKLITNRQRKLIENIREYNGNRVAEQFKQKLFDAVIAEHASILSA